MSHTVTDTAPDADAPAMLTKYFATDEINFTPGERSFVAWVSVETVDHEGDVIVAKGIDYTSVFMKNPVVLAIHNAGTWPVGQCEWLKVKSTPEWTGLFGKAVVDADADSDLVWQKVKGRTVRAVSIRATRPDDFKRGEWGPPTPDELRKNPHWAGAKQVIRRCVMVEFSVCPIGMNPNALITSVAKGLHRPAYAEQPALEPPVAETNPTPEVPADPPVDEVVKAAPPAEDLDDEDADEDDTPVRNGHFVRVTRGPHKGVAGKVKSVHRAGPVPDVDDDVMASKSDPAARVCCYKAMGEGHRETAHHVGVKVSQLERTDDLKPPKVRKAAAPAPLPPIAGRTDNQVAAEKLKAVRLALRPELVAAVVKAEQDRAMGAV